MLYMETVLLIIFIQRKGRLLKKIQEEPKISKIQKLKHLKNVSLNRII